jgi:hypothetical protein
MNPHDRFEPRDASTVTHLQGNILHYSYRTVEEHLRKIEYFSTIASGAYFERGIRSTWMHRLFSPVIRFVRDYLVKAGILDGKEGFRIAWLTATEVRLKYVKLARLWQAARR